MKEKFLILCAVLFAIMFNGYGQQPELVLKNSISGKEKIFHEGKRLKVVCHDGHIYKGCLKLNDPENKLAENEIEIGEVKVNLEKIDAIKTIPIGGKIIGGILTGGGSVITIAGIITCVFSGEQVTDTGVAMAQIVGFYTIGVGIAVAIVGIIILTSGKKFERPLWEYSLQTQ